MIWLTWRQFRTQAWFGAAAVAAVVTALLITAPTVSRLYRDTGLAACDSDCGRLTSAFLGQVRTGSTGVLYFVGVGLMIVVPALIGLFWGAPLLARELETGTYRLAWTQSVTRHRWLAVKLLGVGLAVVTTTGVLSLAVTWWTRTIDAADQNRMFPEIFSARGLVPIGYATFAFVAGVTAGMLLRKTIPAMVVTLVVVVAAQVMTPFLVREHLIAATHATVPLTADGIRSAMFSDERATITGRVDQPGAWVVRNETITPSGAVFVGPADPLTCGPEAGPAKCNEWLGSQNLRQRQVYVTADNFWALQWRETMLYLAVSLALAGFCFWWIRKRMT